jgi:hypothetical protein
VFANCQNKHSAPGFCTFSGSALLRLYLYTKNEKYLLTLIDIAHGITQYVSYPGREVYDIEGNMLTYGQICERVSTSDWEGYDHIGEVSNYSCWCEVSAMLTYTDLPGVIILKENKKMYILDHVQGEITGNSVVITNNSDSTINTKVFVVDNQLNYVGSNLDHFYMDFKIKSKKSDTVWL